MRLGFSTKSVSEVSGATKIPADFNIYIINNSGIYTIEGTVMGKYIDVKAPDVTIMGIVIQLLKEKAIQMKNGIKAIFAEVVYQVF